MKEVFKVQQPVMGNVPDWLIYNKDRSIMLQIHPVAISNKMAKAMGERAKMFVYGYKTEDGFKYIKQAPWQTW